MHFSQLHSRFRTACREEKVLPPPVVSVYQLVLLREEFSSGRDRMQEIFSTKKKKKKKGWGSKYWQNTVIAVPAWVGKQEIKEVQPRRKVVENCRKSWREGLTVQDHSSSVNYFITFPERIS